MAAPHVSRTVVYEINTSESQTSGSMSVSGSTISDLAMPSSAASTATANEFVVVDRKKESGRSRARIRGSRQGRGSRSGTVSPAGSLRSKRSGSSGEAAPPKPTKVVGSSGKFKKDKGAATQFTDRPIFSGRPVNERTANVTPVVHTANRHRMITDRNTMARRTRPGDGSPPPPPPGGVGGSVQADFPDPKYVPDAPPRDEEDPMDCSMEEVLQRVEQRNLLYDQRVTNLQCQINIQQGVDPQIVADLRAQLQHLVDERTRYRQFGNQRIAEVGQMAQNIANYAAQQEQRAQQAETYALAAHEAAHVTDQRAQRAEAYAIAVNEAAHVVTQVAHQQTQESVNHVEQIRREANDFAQSVDIERERLRQQFEQDARTQREELETERARLTAIEVDRQRWFLDRDKERQCQLEDETQKLQLRYSSEYKAQRDRDAQRFSDLKEENEQYRTQIQAAQSSAREETILAVSQPLTGHAASSHARGPTTPIIFDVSAIPHVVSTGSSGDSNPNSKQATLMFQPVQQRSVARTAPAASPTRSKRASKSSRVPSKPHTNERRGTPAVAEEPPKSAPAESAPATVANSPSTKGASAAAGPDTNQRSGQTTIDKLKSSSTTSKESKSSKSHFANSARSSTDQAPGASTRSPPPARTSEPNRFCFNCGKPIPPTDKFCSMCGAANKHYIGGSGKESTKKSRREKSRAQRC